MKLSEVARYWAARELTRIEYDAAGGVLKLRAPFACDEFTLSLPVSADSRPEGLREVSGRLKLDPGSWCRESGNMLLCLKLPKGETEVRFSP